MPKTKDQYLEQIQSLFNEANSVLSQDEFCELCDEVANDADEHVAAIELEDAEKAVDKDLAQEDEKGNYQVTNLS